MLPAAARLTRSQDFGLVIRRGRRAGRPRLVVHALMDGGQRAGIRSSSPTRGRGSPPRVGFVVSKAVGNAVVRHRVARRLRHLMRDRLAALPEGTDLVVRALPPSADATSRDLGADLDATLRRLRLLSPAENGGDAR
ncbi:ribonuclease P protein component [Gandjariella thermophila]|uniref:Ribonuclease P protein component n=1 Tax=Gandjariella thermophila TaxID=1931992 RepID=A0A4D4J2S5_9PSEU|nr:ribonuclease P protein component [Gandjariella thermophila]GDY30935.1 ribonuclease P protein component [Gandjariella thermophila]